MADAMASTLTTTNRIVCAREENFSDHVWSLNTAAQGALTTFMLNILGFLSRTFLRAVISGKQAGN
jgi:hypothetical protein